MPLESPCPEMISFVVPVYRRAEHIRELSERLLAVAATLDHLRPEIIFVDDCSPGPSWHIIGELVRKRRSAVAGIRLSRNVGQHGATLVGLNRARGSWCVALDCDLQDPPEAIPALLSAAGQHYEVVFAGRRGRYQSLGRMLTGEAHRRMLSLLAGVPADAALFFAVRRTAVERLLDLPVATPSLIAMIGLARLAASSVPISRDTQVGTDYSMRLRARTSLRMLRCIAEARFGLVKLPIRTHVDALSRDIEVA